MWRHVVPGFFAVAISGFIGCHCEEDYQCVVRYDPWYGSYYQYCYAVPEGDWEHRQCESGNCKAGHNGACTYNSDCPTGDVCSAGKCVNRDATGGSANGAGGAEVDGGLMPGSPGTNGTSADSGTSEPGDAMTGAGGSSSGGVTGAGENPGAGTTGAGGRSGSGGRGATDGGSTGSGGSSSGSGGKVSVGGSSGTTAAGGGNGVGGSGNTGA